MRRLFLTALLCFSALSLTSSSSGAASQALVLIPGTLNSIALGSYRWDPSRWTLEISPYYSRDVFDAFQHQGFDVFIVKNLHPTGDLTLNGDSAAEQIRSWYLEKYSGKKNVPVAIVAHSAGGFYALEAATRLSDLPIRRIVCLSTPFKGTEIAQDFFEPEGHWFRLWVSVVSFFQKHIDFRGLTSVTPARVAKFLSHVRISPQTQVWAIAGRQDPPHSLKEINDPRKLSLFFTLLRHWIPIPSDGLVTVESALGSGVRIPRTEGIALPVRSLPNENLDLDHPEQVFDYRLFALLGTRDIDWIQSEQRKFYLDLADRLSKELSSASVPQTKQTPRHP